MEPKSIFIVAGESSGDIHASKLIKEIKELKPDLKFVGIGGNKMIDAGLVNLFPLENISVVGFFEVLKNIKEIRKAFQICKEYLETKKIELVILVDFPGFNIKIAQYAKGLGIPVCYYIAPQMWAWGKGRLKKFKENIDLLLVVFPFEKDFFSNEVQNVEFVGHPLLDEPFFQNEFLNYEERENSIALLPGSRISEIYHHKKLVVELIHSITKEYPNYRIRIPFPNAAIPKKLIEEFRKASSNVKLEANSYEVMKNSKVGIIKSGTSNLEAALLGLPFIMFYKTSFLTYFIAKNLIELDYISIVNILKREKIIQEFIQKEAEPKRILIELKQLIENKTYYNQLQESFLEIRKLLGGAGASVRAANKILDYFDL